MIAGTGVALAEVVALGREAVSARTDACAIVGLRASPIAFGLAIGSALAGATR